MSWIKTASKCALATGAILLSAGCTSKKDVAIAAKDDTIRRQEAALISERENSASASRTASEQAEIARRNAELNRQLSQENQQIVSHYKEATAVTNQQTAQIVRLNSEMDELQALVKGINTKTIVVNSPGAPLQGDQTGGVHRHPDNSIHISVAGSVLFEAGHAELKPGSSDTLMRIAQTLKSQYPNNSFRIEGHTDSTPVVHSKDRYPDNMALSQARAAAVYDFLSRRGGISGSKMYTAGYGDRQPLVSPERTAGDRAKNRRVEIVILPNNLKVQKERLAQGEGPARAYQASTAAAKK